MASRSAAALGAPAVLPPVRDAMCDVMAKLMVGPFSADETIEGLRSAEDPTDFYLTGILWPQDATLEGDETDESAGPADKGDKDTGDEPAAPLFNTRKPSSVGLTCTLERVDTAFTIRVTGATYKRSGEGGPEDELRRYDWTRIPFDYSIDVSESETRTSWREESFQMLGGGVDEHVQIHVLRRVRTPGLVVTVTLLNRAKGVLRGETCLYQTRLAVSASDGGVGRIVSRPPEAGLSEQDSASAALLYRHRQEFAVGHGASVSWTESREGHVETVHTEWMPRVAVGAMSPTREPMLTQFLEKSPGRLKASRFADSKKRTECLADLLALHELYDRWIKDRRAEAVSLEVRLRDVANQHLDVCVKASGRIREGVALLSSDPISWEAFCLANQAMNAQSQSPVKGSRAGPLTWYPFQLAFVLMSLPSVSDLKHPDRETLDLLWFPTGGGKTEAYLCLTAYAIFNRRLRGQGESPHVDVLMRYTLRLLTVQQFQRAAAMICAAELMRRRDSKRLGKTPISIGLYVGEGATPNRVVGEGFSAVAQLDQERKGEQPGCTPRLVTECPLCATPLGPNDYQVDEKTPRVDVVCPAKACPSLGLPLQIFTVDEDVYREKPSLLIATVDKFAQLPRNEQVGRLLGVDGLPPELIIQDELHLISGPLGTVTGLYEAVIDLLCARNGKRVKIIGSTATIGRANDQVRALFDRDVLQFPPPGLSAEDSFFAVRDSKAPDRMYIGISSTGRSPKFTFQAVTAASLMAAQYLQGTHGDAVIDPYWTCLAYFNSLRELGGALVQVRDDVNKTSAFYAGRLGVVARETYGLPTEITSRVTSTKLPAILSSLGIKLTDDPMKGRSEDVVLASNMISVGMDIPRLGLMLVNGQPKSSAEYIQATSRVGRGIDGLVATIFNSARPRDVSHFEHFTHLHQTLYRRVEVTSVTPWSPRARERALHAVFISGVRYLGESKLRPRDGAVHFEASSPVAEIVRKWVVERSERSGGPPEQSEQVERELKGIAEQWSTRAAQLRQSPTGLEYWARRNPHNNVAVTPYLMVAAEEAGAVDSWIWRTPNSMRGVEPSARYASWTQLPMAQVVQPRRPQRTAPPRAGLGAKRISGKSKPTGGKR